MNNTAPPFSFLLPLSLSLSALRLLQCFFSLLYPLSVSIYLSTFLFPFCFDCIVRAGFCNWTTDVKPSIFLCLLKFWGSCMWGLIEFAVSSLTLSGVWSLQRLMLIRGGFYFYAIIFSFPSLSVIQFLHLLLLKQVLSLTHELVLYVVLQA